MSCCPKSSFHQFDGKSLLLSLTITFDPPSSLLKSMIGSNSSLAEDPLTKCNLNPLHSLRRSTRTMSRNIARNPPPRQLTIKETLETLTHWETTFKIYYKRDEIYRAFFKADFKWNPNEECFGLQDETAGSNPRTKAGVMRRSQGPSQYFLWIPATLIFNRKDFKIFIMEISVEDSS